MDGRKLSEKRFRIVFVILRIGGLPVYMEKVSFLFKIYMAFALLAIYSIYLAIVVDAINHMDDLKHAMASIRAVVGFSDFLWPLTYFSLFRGKFDRLIHLTEQFTWEELPTKDPETGDTTMAGWIMKTQMISKNLYTFCIVFHLCQSIYRMVSFHVMMFNSRYPFDATISPIYEFVNIYQFYGTHVALCTFYGSTTLYAVIVSVACSQLEKVRISLLNLKQSQDMQEQFSQCIRLHQQTLEYMNEIEEALNIFFCVQMLILFIATCFVAFSAVTSWGDYADVSQAFLGYFIMTQHIFVLCWFGTKLTEKAESVRGAAWECDWVGTSTSFQKSIMFIIARGNTKFALTAGKIFPLSNETLLNMMNECLSFFMFLLHVKGRNENVNGTEHENAHMDTHTEI